MKQFCFFLLLAGLTVLAGCGGGTSMPANSNGALAGNWQFTLSSPEDNSFVGGLQGGFLLQNQNSVTGAVAYAISIPPPSSGSAPTVMPVPCNSGSAPISGTINEQKVMLTAAAGGQTFTFTGTLSSDGLIMMGTYTSSAGINVSGVTCGTAQSGLQWKAALVPPLNGTVTGSFHSKASGILGNQDFPVTGTLQQGQNIGASSANVTGTLTFQNYSCLGGSSHQTITVNGGISGNSVVLQLFADNGLQIGQIGQSLGLNTQVAPVVFENAAAGSYVLHNNGPQNSYGYVVKTKSCSSGTFPQDQGNICLDFGNGTSCAQPISLSPSALTFPTQLVGFSSTIQTITLTNTDPSGATLGGLSLAWNPAAGSVPISGFSDFNGFPNFLELDTCASPPGSTFSLQPQQSCKITIFFSPQQSCSWLPTNPGVAPSRCPPFLGGTLSSPPALTAAVTVNVPKSSSLNTAFTVPVSGTGLSAVVPSTPEIDFGAEAVGQSSNPQQLSFTNSGTFPVQILPAATLSKACSTISVTIPRPIQTGNIDGLRVVQGVQSGFIAAGGTPTLSYTCDVDLVSHKANFQISSDSCTGTLLYPEDSCSLNVAYVPQPGTPTANGGLDYFLELNTQECSGTSVQPNCEIDSGRFPVELTANASSPLRMSPGAGLDFGTQRHLTPSTPLTITLTNDSTIANPATVNFQGNIVTGDFTETDDCGASLAPGSSCTLNVVFTPLSTSYEQGTITINYTTPGSQSLTQLVHLRGFGQ